MAGQTNLQKWSEEELVPLSDNREDALWIIVYGIDKFYLTNEEKQYFLKSLENGAKFVQIQGSILTDKFLYISLDEDKYAELKKRNHPDRDAFGGALVPRPLDTLSPEERAREEKKREAAREKTRQALKNIGVIKS